MKKQSQTTSNGMGILSKLIVYFLPLYMYVYTRYKYMCMYQMVKTNQCNLPVITTVV